MGCVCAKGISSEERAEIKREKGARKLSKRFVSSSLKQDDIVVTDADADAVGGNDVGTVRLIQRPYDNEISVSSHPFDSDEEREPARDVPPLLKVNGHTRNAAGGVGGTRESEPNLRISSVRDGREAEYLAAGWPSWLASVAGDAIKGWVPRKASSFEKLEKIGQGTYSNVYKARDLETGKIVALKKVRFVNMDPESVRFMAREIYVLRRLDHPNIVKLEGLVTSSVSRSLCLVFEYMEHDLAGLAATPAIKFSEPQVKCYMQQLLRGLHHCHSRGVLHRDIKGSNLLIDNNGILKIADFGLATFFNPEKKQSLTSRVVTLWYRPPELLLGATEYGVAVDLWSTGCILAELLGGKPIMPGRTEVEQLHKIFKLCGSPSEEYWQKSKLPHATIFKPQHPYRRVVHETFKDFPSSALSLLDVLLAFESENRGTAASALESNFFKTKPYACDPSSLPKYPPSKEMDAKFREEEARRQRAAAMKGHGSQSMKRGSKDSKEVVEDTAIMEKRHAQPNHRSSRDKYKPQEDSASQFTFNPSEVAAHNDSWGRKVRDVEQRIVSGRSLSTRRDSNISEFKAQRTHIHQGGGDVSSFSGLLVPARMSSNMRDQRDMSGGWLEQGSRRYQIDAAEASGKQHMDHLLERPTSSQKKDMGLAVQGPSSGYATKKNRMHYSGPLISQGENLEEMLKEHERQIQQAVRKARVDKGNTRTRRNNG